MLDTYLQTLFLQKSLRSQEAEAVTDLILDNADPLQIAALLALLRYRGETAEEVAGMVRSLEKKALPVRFPFPVMDIVGTGGDLAGTVNISTGAAILAAACGIPVAKHGNRSVSSRCGSADLLEALGIDIELSPVHLEACLREVNMAFMFAPAFHPCLKKIAPIRKGLKLPTVFNILGPLLNPAKAEYALIGAANEFALELISKVLLQMGNKKRAFVFHGCGLDELTPLGPAVAYDICGGRMRRLDIDPKDLGFPLCSLKDLQGEDAQTNASILNAAFAGKAGAVADALVLNAGAALWIFNRAASLKEGVGAARRALQEGKALHLLEKWRRFSKKMKEEGET